MDAVLVRKYEKTEASLRAASFGRCAVFAIRVVVERSTNPADPCFGKCIDMFADDAYKAAVRAAHAARQRLDMDPLTKAQQRMLALIQRMTMAQGDWTPKTDWVQWWDLVNEWQRAPLSFGPDAANRAWDELLARQLVEHHPDNDDLVRAVRP